MNKKVQFEEMFPWELSAAIENAPICYIPLGVLEWHGEHNAVGLDAIKAHAVCVQSARLSGGVVLPALYWATDSLEEIDKRSYLTGGIESGERYHVPGNMFYIRPETFHHLLLDIFIAVERRGFKVIMVITGHWSKTGNLPVIQASGKEFLSNYPLMKWMMLTDQELVPDLHYPWEHAAGGETSLLMAIRPDLVDLSKTLATDTVLRDYYKGHPAHLEKRRKSKNKYIGVLTGTDDDTNDPELTASVERGQILLDAISKRVADRALGLLCDAGKKT